MLKARFSDNRDPEKARDFDIIDILFFARLIQLGRFDRSDNLLRYNRNDLVDAVIFDINTTKGLEVMTSLDIEAVIAHLDKLEALSLIINSKDTWYKPEHSHIYVNGIQLLFSMFRFVMNQPELQETLGVLSWQDTAKAPYDEEAFLRGLNVDTISQLNVKELSILGLTSEVQNEEGERARPNLMESKEVLTKIEGLISKTPFIFERIDE